MEQIDAFDDELQTLHEQLLEELYYDPETGDWKWLKEGQARRLDISAGCLDKAMGYNRIFFKGKLYQGSRLAYFYMTGEWPPEHMDHINGDRGDDRWENLRSVTAQENHRNRKRASNNKSGVAGVTWIKAARKWKAHIKPSAQDADEYLGLFESFSDAVEARKAAEVKYGYHPNHGREA